MTQAYLAHIAGTLDQIASEGMMKRERAITSPQSGTISVGERTVINLCANNYLGLADHPDLIAAARDAMEPRGIFRTPALPPLEGGTDPSGELLLKVEIETGSHQGRRRKGSSHLNVA